MDYSQFLHMREELSLVVVLLLLFLADLFMSPDAHKNDGKARLNTMFPVILMAIHTAINLIPGTAADIFGGMYHYVPMHTVIKSILNVGTLIVFLMAHEWMKREDTSFKQGEFYVLTLSTLFGMYLMISAGHFLMFFIGLETASVPMAALIAFDKYRHNSAEAGAKYILTVLPEPCISMTFPPILTETRYRLWHLYSSLRVWHSSYRSFRSIFGRQTFTKEPRVRSPLT